MNAAQIFVTVEIQRGQIDFAMETDVITEGVPSGWVLVPEAIMEEWKTLNAEMKAYLKKQLTAEKGSSKANDLATVAASMTVEKDA